MGARYGQKMFGRVRKWLHSDALRREGADLTYLTLNLPKNETYRLFTLSLILPEISLYCALEPWAV